MQEIQDSFIDVDDLYETFSRAVKARKGSDRKTARKPRFFAPSGSASHRKDMRDSYFQRWSSFLSRVGLRTLNDWKAQGREVPSLDELRTVFIHWLDENAYSGDEGLTPYAQEKMAASLAAHLLDVWDPDYIERWREWGRKSHQDPNRRYATPRFKTQSLVGIEHYTIRETAKALGCSIATAKRVRARRRAEITAQAAVQDDLPVASSGRRVVLSMVRVNRKRVSRIVPVMGRIWETVRQYDTRPATVVLRT